MRTSKDLYGLLELSRGASREDVRKAYRRMVREYHPDTNPGDDSAEERFKEFQHAYEVLSDLRKRREYDEVLLRASAGLVPKLLDFHNNPRVNSWKTCVSVLALFLIIDGFLFYRYGQQDNSAPGPPATASKSQSIATSAEDGVGRRAGTQAEENDTHLDAIDHEQQDSSSYLRETEPVATEDLRPSLLSSTASANLPTPVIVEEGLTILPGSVEAVPVQDARSVGIGDNFFDPPDAAVEPGTTITWTNNGALPHTVTADDGSFDSGVLDPGDSYTVTIGGQGTVTYHCTIHPEMRGSVTVGGGGTAPPAEQSVSETMPPSMEAGESY